MILRRPLDAALGLLVWCGFVVARRVFRRPLDLSDDLTMKENSYG